VIDDEGLCKELAGLFATEAADMLDRVEQALGELVATPGATAASADVRRVLHGFKGAAYSAGFRALGDLAHALEDALPSSGSSGQVLDAATLAAGRPAGGGAAVPPQGIAATANDPSLL
jgi:chemotaxis protein histidine kinase CheA